MKYCTTCGKTIEIEDKFCANCGYPLEPDKPVPPQEQPSPPNDASSDASDQSSVATEQAGDAQNYTKRKTSSCSTFRNRAILLASIAVLVVLVVAFVFKFNRIQSQEEADEKTILLPNGVNLVLRAVPNGLWFGKFEVTQAQWEAVMGENPSEFKGANNPVENVSWNDCQTFLKKLHALPTIKNSGLTFRLPKGAEWEYACRAGAEGDYCKLTDGTEITKSMLGKVAWFEDNSDKKTHPVGQKQPNAFGLYDMHGNVWEWCQEEYFSPFAQDETAPYDRVMRGGSWFTSAWQCESSFRGGVSPSDRSIFRGFRLCASATIEMLCANMVQIPGKNCKMGKYEVTQAQWEAVMGENPSAFRGKNNPVENVSWDDCRVFLEKLNALTVVKESGLTFRLPTVEEWEYACRAGAEGDYCKLADGTEITEETLGEVAWFADNSDDKTHPVGQKRPNAFGLYDMHGNVWEWCQEEFGAVVSWAKGKAYEHTRVNRGGCWHHPAKGCKSSFWHSSEPSIGNRGGIIGFRLCADRRAD